ncbi:MAG TPA: hypothetical protein PK280_08205 [Planctomycetota bacterium]|nr:hypothetical protein [Planctomycetota bacterium]
MAGKANQPWWRTEGVWEGPCKQEPEAHSIRRGNCPEDILERTAAYFTEENARRVCADDRWNFSENLFYKGLGLEHERPEWERTARFYAAIRRHDPNGKKHLGVYTQWAPFFAETLFAELPEARKGVQVDSDGRPIEYNDTWNQYYRWRMCPSWPGFVEYMKKAAEVAVREVGADVVYYDNMCIFENHDSLCHCDGCQREFRAYMERKFPTAEALYLRTGLRVHDDIRIPRCRPWTDYTLRAWPIHDPVLQECITFRCEQLSRAWAEVAAHIRSVNPKAGIMGNPSFPRKYNERLTSAIDFWLLKDTEAMHWMENAVRNIGVREGAVVSNIRGYKYSRALGSNITFMPCGSEAEPGLALAEGMAFNNGSGVVAGASRAAWDFLQKHLGEFYRDVEILPEVAVLRDDRSLTLRWHETFMVMETAQQQLTAAGLPWMPLWGQQLLDGTLGKYKVLVVPGCGCPSRAELAAIEKFVATGGTAVICEKAGCYNEFHQTIREWRFAPLFAAAGAKPEGFAVSYTDRGYLADFANSRRPMVAPFGKGRAVYLPLVRNSAKPVATYEEMGGYEGFAYLKLGRKWRTLPDAVEKNAVQPLAARVKAPWTVAAEFLRKIGSKRLLVHLVNYAKKPAAAGVALVLAEGAGRRVRLYVPDGRIDGRELKAAVSKGGAASYKLPAFARYALVVVD